MTETDTTGLNTQSVLQYARLLMPTQITGEKSPPKNFAYKQGGKCLSDFSQAGCRGWCPSICTSAAARPTRPSS